MRSRGQREIDSERAREIQQALIREKYLDGEPSGTWDESTKEAMTRFQSDNGWQTKIVPDSRALIKLGLGPNHAGLINPAGESPMLLPDSARDMVPGGADQQR
jgi:peptidoglycan hydrolase-like protein with peptidoglycan-binding domain